jgi:hypothetical protein
VIDRLQYDKHVCYKVQVVVNFGDDCLAKREEFNLESIFNLNPIAEGGRGKRFNII